MFELYGQDAVKRQLYNQINKNEISHAYIFSGNPGLGKKTLAGQFAKAIFCEGQNKPCNACKPCLLVNSKAHPDFKVIKEEDKKQLSVETIRNMVRDIYIKPYLAKKKVYVIHDAHTMTAASQNALLKVFEEPPLYAVIILISQDDKKLLPTIRSRAQVLRFLPNKREEVLEYIQKNHNIDEKYANFIANISEGNIGKAESLLNNPEYFSLRQNFIESLLCLQHEKSHCFGIAGFFEKYDINFLFDFFSSFLRDALILKVLGDELRLINQDFSEKIRAFCENVTAKGILASLNLVLDTKAKMTQSSKENLWILELLLNCWEELHGESHWSQV